MTELNGKDLTERVITPMEIEIAARYAKAFMDSIGLIAEERFTSIETDQRMMTFLFAIIRDKIKIGRTVENIPDDIATPGYFYLEVVENLMQLANVSVLAFKQMADMSAEKLDFILQGKDPGKEQMPEN